MNATVKTLQIMLMIHLLVICELAGASPATARDRRPGPYRRPFVTGLFAVPMATYVGPQGPRRSQVLYPSDRFAMTELVGGGYVVNPRFRFGAIAIFNEVLTNLPAGASAWQLGGVAPIAIGTLGHFIVGGGPIIGYRSGGLRRSDFGVVTLAGASIAIRKGLTLNVAVPVTSMLTHRTTVSVGVAAGISRIF